MSKWKIKFEGVVNIHLIDPQSDEYTLCGLSTSGDEYIELSDAEIVTDEKCNCSRCIAIVQYCKNISIKHLKRS
jgi:hypothetical protein